MSLDQRVARLTSPQYGLLSDEQARLAGATHAQVRHRLAVGRWIRPHPGVLGINGTPLSFEGHLMAAVLAAGPGAVVSHRAAARVWGLDGGEEIVEITVPYDQAPDLDGTVVHRSLDLVDEHISRCRHLPVTDPLRLLVDLGAVRSHDTVRRTLEHALSRGLVTMDGVVRRHTELARRGRRGCGVLRRIMEERALGMTRPDSVLEAMMARVLKGSGIELEFQHEVIITGRCYRIDFARPELLLAIEVDGIEKFTDSRVVQNTFERQNALHAAGWIVLRFTWADIVTRPGYVVAVIRREIERRSRPPTVP